MFSASSRLDAPAISVNKEDRRTTIRHRTLTSFGCFPNRFTVPAAHRERKRTQTCLGDLASALEAVAVIAFLNATERSVYVLQCLRLQPDQREFDIVLDFYLGAFGSVEHISVPDSVASDVAHSVLNFMRKLRASTLENRPEVIKAACSCYNGGGSQHEMPAVLRCDGSDTLDLCPLLWRAVRKSGRPRNVARYYVVRSSGFPLARLGQ